jgi:hypothetical protein
MIGTENIAIKKYLKSLQNGYENWNVPLPDIMLPLPLVDSFRGRILNIVDTDKPWLVKTSNLLHTWRLWNQAWPSARWIFPIRSVWNIVDSAKRHPVMKRRGKKIEPFVKALIERQELVKQSVMFSYSVSVDALVRHQDCQGMVEWAGLNYNPDIPKKFIDQGMYHYA